ncbi:DinB family protein [Chryseomicrobium sp. FSL W7-1435]|uniref:DinB family protein n=1 Tax=Chryseomicrobium sp. FSL W7-1435 TaxID=2921704 RepID=UPI00315A6BF4
MDTLRHLNTTRDELIHELHAIPDTLFSKQPDKTTWSPQQVTEHIALMDSYVASLLDRGKAVQKKVMKKPIRLTTLRSIKVKAPGPVDPATQEKTKEDIYELLFESRMQVLTLYKKFSKLEKRTFAMKHPVFGYLTVEQWFDFLGYHEKRHLKQLREVVSQLKL